MSAERKLTRGPDPLHDLSRKSDRPRADGPFPDLFAGGRRRGFALLVAAGVGQGAVSAGMALLMKTGFDALFDRSSQDVGGQAMLLGALVASVAAAGLLKWYAHVEAERIGQSYAHALRMRLFRKLIAAGGNPRSRRGAVLLRLSGDMTPIRQWVSRGLSQLIVGGLTFALSVAALAAIDMRIAAIVSVTLSVAAFVSVALGRGLSQATVDARRRRGRLANAAGARIVGAEDAEAPAPARRERRKLRKLSRRVRDALLERAYYAGALRAIAESGAALAGVLSLGIGVAVSAQGGLSPGAVVSAVFISGLLAPQVHQMSRCLEYWTAATVARRKQAELFEELTAGG